MRPLPLVTALCVTMLLILDVHGSDDPVPDGALAESPAAIPAPVSARVLGEELHTTNPDEIQYELLDRLFDDYAAQHELSATGDEVNAYIETMDRRMKADLGDEYESPEDLSPEDAAELRAMRETMAGAMIQRWKLNRALHQEYGGRVIHQQLGPEPLDAYRQYLEARQAAGDFEIVDEAARRYFWDYFTNESRHDFMDEAQAAQAFDQPPWEGD